MPNSWRCDCGAYNGSVAKFCEDCGAERTVPNRAAVQERQPEERPIAAPTDRCTEPGCTLTVEEHREAFKRAMRRFAVRSAMLTDGATR